MRQYSLPSGAVGRLFLETFTKEWQGMLDHRGNSERTLVFLLVVLQWSHGVRRSTDICHRIKQWLLLWSDATNHKAMVTDTMAKVTS